MPAPAEDDLYPVYCHRCRNRMPRAKLDAHGLCTMCAQDLAAGQARLQADAAKQAAQAAAAPGDSSKQTIQLPPGQHNPGVAVLLALLPPIICLYGIGQFYNRQVLKGVLALFGAPFVALFVGLGSVVRYYAGFYGSVLAEVDGKPASPAPSPAFLCIGPLLIFAVWVLLAIDAGRVASRLSRGEPVRTGQWF